MTKGCKWLRGRAGTVHASCCLDEGAEPFPEGWDSKWCDDPDGPRCGPVVARLLKSAKVVVDCEYEETRTQNPVENRWECSECGSDVYSPPGEPPSDWHFCPGCGAKIATWRMLQG